MVWPRASCISLGLQDLLGGPTRPSNFLFSRSPAFVAWSHDS